MLYGTKVIFFSTYKSRIGSIKVSRLMFDNLTKNFVFYFKVYNYLISYYDIHEGIYILWLAFCILIMNIFFCISVLCYSKERQLCSNFTYMWKENVLNKSNDVTYCSTYFFLRFLIWKWIFNSVIFKFRLSLLGKFIHKFISSHFSIYIIYTLLVALFCY